MSKYFNTETNEEISIWGMYDLVFVDMVKSHLESINYMKDEKTILSESEIEDIAYNMLYKNEYLWEIISETIDSYIDSLKEESEEE